MRMAGATIQARMPRYGFARGCVASRTTRKARLASATTAMPRPIWLTRLRAKPGGFVLSATATTLVLLPPQNELDARRAEGDRVEQACRLGDSLCNGDGDRPA